MFYSKLSMGWKSVYTSHIIYFYYSPDKDNKALFLHEDMVSGGLSLVHVILQIETDFNIFVPKKSQLK